MKKLLLSASACAVVLGVWSGWRAGSHASLRSAGPDLTAGPPLASGQNHTVSLTPGPVPGSVSLREWRDFTQGDPQGCQPGDMACMARVRELARGLSMEDLRGAIEEGMEETLADNSSSIQLGQLIGELARRNAAQACDLLFRKNYWRSDGNVFVEWGRQDSQAAFAWIGAHPKFGSYRYEIIRGWAESSPAEAFQVMVDLEEKGDRDGSDEDWTSNAERITRSDFLALWAKKDPEAAVAACVAHADLPFCRHANWEPALSDMNPDQRGRLMACLRSITDPDLRASVFTGCANFFATSDDPQQAIALAEDQLLPDDEKLAIRRAVLDSWSTRDSVQSGADWYWNTSPPGQESTALKDVLETWANRAESLAGPLSWLQSLPPDQLPANAPEIFAKAGFPVDPVPALQGWLALQPAGEVRPEALTRLGQYLSSAPQATRLTALLQEADFPADLSARLLAATGLTSN